MNPDRRTAKTGWRETTVGPAVLPDITKIPLPRGTETVLVVDDEPMLRRVIVITLNHLGYHVLEASSTLEAQRVANSHAGIQLLLTDYCMPGADGMQLALWFRATYPETRVLIASANLWELDFNLSASQQFAFLGKPFTLLELASKVRSVLG